MAKRKKGEGPKELEERIVQAYLADRGKRPYGLIVLECEEKYYLEKLKGCKRKDGAPEPLFEGRTGEIVEARLREYQVAFYMLSTFDDSRVPDLGPELLSLRELVEVPKKWGAIRRKHAQWCIQGLGYIAAIREAIKSGNAMEAAEIAISYRGRLEKVVTTDAFVLEMFSKNVQKLAQPQRLKGKTNEKRVQEALTAGRKSHPKEKPTPAVKHVAKQLGLSESAVWKAKRRLKKKATVRR